MVCLSRISCPRNNRSNSRRRGISVGKQKFTRYLVPRTDLFRNDHTHPHLDNRKMLPRASTLYRSQRGARGPRKRIDPFTQETSHHPKINKKIALFLDNLIIAKRQTLCCDCAHAIARPIQANLTGLDLRVPVKKSD